MISEYEYFRYTKLPIVNLTALPQNLAKEEASRLYREYLHWGDFYRLLWNPFNPNVAIHIPTRTQGLISLEPGSPGHKVILSGGSCGKALHAEDPIRFPWYDPNEIPPKFRLKVTTR